MLGHASNPQKRKYDEPLAFKVDSLASELAQILALLLNLQLGSHSATAVT